MNFIPTLINMFVADKALQANYTAGEYVEGITAWIPDQFNITQPVKMGLSWIPQLIKPGIETAFGVKSWPTIRPMESRSLQAREPGLRYYESTTEFAKFIGKTFNLSPIKIDHLITGYLGRATGFLTGKPGVYNPLRTMNRQLYFTSTRQIQLYYDLKEKNDQQYSDYKNKRRTFKVGERTEILRLREKLKAIDHYLDLYREIDIEKHKEKADQYASKIISLINKL